MAEQADIIGALREQLLADPDLYALTSGRVFCLELPRTEARSMPRKCVVLSYAGGPADRGLVELATVRIDCLCYGETAFEADRVRRTVHGDLKHTVRKIYDDVLIHNATASSGALFTVDPDTGWKISAQSWMVTAAEHIAA